MAKAKTLGCTGPTLTNGAGTARISEGPTSFTGVEADYYWSGTPENTGYAWFGDLDHVNMLKRIVIDKFWVRPVQHLTPGQYWPLPSPDLTDRPPLRAQLGVQGMYSPGIGFESEVLR